MSFLVIAAWRRVAGPLLKGARLNDSEFFFFLRLSFTILRLIKRLLPFRRPTATEITLDSVSRQGSSVKNPFDDSMKVPGLELEFHVVS
jgi:hypothetical protein